jgi:hypothetical protein
MLKKSEGVESAHTQSNAGIALRAQVAGAIQRYELSTLGSALLFAVASITTLTNYDLLGRL